MVSLSIGLDIYRWISIGKNATEFYWMAASAALAHPSTRTTGVRMFSYGIRASAAGARGAVLGRGAGFMGTTFVRGGTASLATSGALVGQALAAVAVPVICGYGLSYAINGDQGVDDFSDFLTLNVSPGNYYRTVSQALWA